MLMGGGWEFGGDMYIEPNSTIELFSRIPLNPDYSDTLLFDSPEAQTAYFGLQPNKFTFHRNSYQRSGRGWCKLEAKIGDIINCNYMRFKNTNHSDKWFYAFIIDEPQYINENTVLIKYAIDIMQTYAFDYELTECFVEREHSATDVIGENLQEEPVDLGDYVALSTERSGVFPTGTATSDRMMILLLRGKAPLEE